MATISYISMRSWWCQDCSRPACRVRFL